MKFMDCLSRQEVISVIEGKGAARRLPILYDMWIGSNVFGWDERKREEWLSNYPRDIADVFLNMPDLTQAPADDPDYRWTGIDKGNMDDKGWDARVLIEDWEGEDAEKFFATFPNPDYPGLVPETAPSDGRYMLGRWWYLLFERHWSLRGMENALMDFYLYPDEVHKLYRRLTDFYLRAMERACAELEIDGFFVSDDLGTQNSTFFSLDVFREFFKPYYKEIFDRAHELGVHFWLHSCGNIEQFLPEFIEIGLDVIHPIQKYTMDERKIAQQFGGKICILAGFDVQNTIPFGSAGDVRKEVRYLIDTYGRKDGRLMLTMGNGSTEDWKLDCLQALYEESVAYGKTGRIPNKQPLFIVTGASCVGKSTLCNELFINEKEYIVMEGDLLWNDIYNTPDDDYYEYNRLWLRVCANISQGGKPVVLCGCRVPKQLENLPERKLFTDIHYLAVVCDDAVLEERMRKGRGVHDENWIRSSVDFNKWLKSHSDEADSSPVTLLDTSEISPAQAARIADNWIMDMLPRKL